MVDYLYLIRMSPPTTHRNIIIEYLEGRRRSLPKDVYKELTKDFRVYKEKNGVKPIIQYARKREKQQRQKVIQSKEAVMDTSDQNETTQDIIPSSSSTMLCRQMNVKPNYLVSSQ